MADRKKPAAIYIVSPAYRYIGEVTPVASISIPPMLTQPGDPYGEPPGVTEWKRKSHERLIRLLPLIHCDRCQNDFWRQETALPDGFKFRNQGRLYDEFIDRHVAQHQAHVTEEG